jgi:hypothetical protein
MHTLLRLPLILLETALRQGAGALRDILRLLAGGDQPAAARPAPDPMAARREAEAVAAAEARARRPEARPRAAPRRRPAPAPAPSPEPSPGHISTDAETVASFGPADDPSPAIEVQAPWSGYDSQPAAEVIKRIRSGDEATRAVALLYERGHKGRKSVIRAAGG